MLVTTENRLMHWSLNRPEHENGLDDATMSDMERALDTLDTPASDVCALLITAAPAVFSTGLDQDLLATCFADAARFSDVVVRSRAIIQRIHSLPCLTLACVEGLCKLGGLELATACDLVIAGAGTQISDGHLAYAALPGAGGTKWLTARLGYAGALRFILEAGPLGAEEAARRRLVDQVVPAGTAATQGHKIALRAAALDPELIRGLKASLQAGHDENDTSYAEVFQRLVIDKIPPPEPPRTR